MDFHSTNLAKDLFDLERVEEEVVELTRMVWATQAVGLALIFFGLWWLKTMPPDLSYFWIRFWFAGWAFTVIWWICCWWESIVNSASAILYGIINTVRSWQHSFQNYSNRNGYAESEYPKFKPVSPRRIEDISSPLRKTRVLRAILVLVIADAFFLAVLILISGGPGHSSLDPLLPIIPIIAIILRQPTRTAVVALLLEFAIVLFLGIHWLIHILHIPHLDLSPEWIYNSHNDLNYPVAFAVVAAGGVAMSGIEYYFTHARSKLTKNIPTLVKEFGASIPDLKDLTRAVKRGTNTWIRWLSHRGIPAVDLSLVHDEQSVVRQAVILSIPYWKPKDRLSRQITRHITFMTFAAHWIDDHFDALRVYCPKSALQQEILLSSPEDIIARLHPRLSELVKRMEKLVDSNDIAREQVKRAIVRIIYGGLIQNAPTKERLAQLLDEYKQYIFKDIGENLKSKYREIVSQHPLSIWVTTKVVMELLISCSPDFSVDVAEFYNLLYGPILYYQDRDQEIQMENFGVAFGATPTEIRSQLPSDNDMVSIINTCRSLAPQILGPGMLPRGRKMQLAILRELYRDALPIALFNAYDYFLSTQNQDTATH